jgi:hypothetical protein
VICGTRTLPRGRPVDGPGLLKRGANLRSGPVRDPRLRGGRLRRALKSLPSRLAPDPTPRKAARSRRAIRAPSPHPLIVTCFSALRPSIMVSSFARATLSPASREVKQRNHDRSPCWLSSRQRPMRPTSRPVAGRSQPPGRSRVVASNSSPYGVSKPSISSTTRCTASASRGGRPGTLRPPQLRPVVVVHRLIRFRRRSRSRSGPRCG